MELVERINRAAIIPAAQATIRQSPDGTRRYEYVSKDYLHHDGAVGEFNGIRERIQRFARSNGSFREAPMPPLHQHFSKGCLFRSKSRSIILLIENYLDKYRVVFIAR
jgi:hypothetical protein